MIIFETERLTVRQYQEKDREHFFSLNGNEDVMRYIRPVKSREETDKFFDEVRQAYVESPLAGRWAVNSKNNNEFVGSFAIIPIPNYEVLTQLGYALLKSQWGNGYATELTLAGID